MKRVALAVAVITGSSSPSLSAQTATLPELPQVSGPFTLEAVTDPVSGRSQFRYDGHDVPPVVRVRSGEDIHGQAADIHLGWFREPANDRSLAAGISSVLG